MSPLEEPMLLEVPPPDDAPPLAFCVLEDSVPPLELEASEEVVLLVVGQPETTDHTITKGSATNWMRREAVRMKTPGNVKRAGMLAHD